LQFILVVPARGQFPAACNNADNIRDKECCPNSCSGKGQCEDIRAKASWSTIDGFGKTIVEKIATTTMVYQNMDTRYEWPTRVFTRVCRCNEGYGGAACDECDFGYAMNSGVCQKVSRKRIRKNFQSMSQQEKTDLITVLKEAKTGDYAWAVVVQEPDENGIGLQLQNISTYDLFVYHHYFSKREGDINNIDVVRQEPTPVCNSNGLDLSDVDFAHEGPSFLTWHRYYLLLVERELGRIAERLGSTSWNRYTFALPYWDWDDSEAAFADIFSADHFGTFSKPLTIKANVTGLLFNNGRWPTVCDQHYQFNVNTSDRIPLLCSGIRKVCNPNADRRYKRNLERGVFMKRGRKCCTYEDRVLPDRNTIEYLLNTIYYDRKCETPSESSPDKNLYSPFASGASFRNRVEGFVGFRQDLIGEFKDCGSGDDHNNFHNAVHIYIHGHMRIVPSASNDPIFYLHHVNIDRIFEQWLRGKGSNAEYEPNSNNRVAHPGHNARDYLVPLFPLKTNLDMYKKSSEFGYSYEEQNSDTAAGLSPGALAGIIIAAIVLLCIICTTCILCFCIILCMCC
jgi:tyrosinase